MQPLELNLASRPFKNDTLPWLGVILGTAALVALTTWNVRTYRQNRYWLADLTQRNAEDTRELSELISSEREAQRKIEEYDREVLAIRADKANEVIRWKGFSWTRLFNHMEEVLPNDVQLTAIHPVFRPENPQDEKSLRDLELRGKVPVSVEGTSREIQDFFEFEFNLFQHPHFDQVTPEFTETEPNTGSSLFSLRFLYDPSEHPGEGAAEAAIAAAVEGDEPAEAVPTEARAARAQAEPPPLEDSSLEPANPERVDAGVAPPAVETPPAAQAAAPGGPVVRSFESPNPGGSQPVEATAEPQGEAPRRGGGRRGGGRREGRRAAGGD